MSRISRINVDVTATTHGLESGMRRAEQSVEGFGRRVSGMKEGLEKMRGVLGLGLGGFGVVGLATAAIASADRIVQGLADASERAADALEKLRRDGTPLAASGLTATTAESLAALRPAAQRWKQRGSWQALSDTFSGEAFRNKPGLDAMDSLVSAMRGSAAVAGSGLSELMAGRLTQTFVERGTPEARLSLYRAFQEIGLSVAEAVAPDDQAGFIANMRRAIGGMSDPLWLDLTATKGAR